MIQFHPDPISERLPEGASCSDAPPRSSSQPILSGAPSSGATPHESPLSRRSPRLVALSRDQRQSVGAVLGWDGQAWRVLASLEAVPNQSLDDDVPALVRQLESRLPAGERLPREGILLWSEVVVACVDLPRAEGLSGERLQTLLGWELDPYLAGGPELELRRDGQADVACGWSHAPGPGLLLACGLRPLARDAARAAFGRAKLRLRGLYPLLGCAPAELPPGQGPREVLELGLGSVATSRVEAGRVVRTRTTRCAPGREAATALGLISGEVETLIAGPVAPALRASLVGEPWTELPAPADLPVGLLGAARHALELPGGGRLAAVPPAPKRSFKLPAPLAWTLLAGLLATALVGGVEQQLGALLGQTRADLRLARERSDAGQRAGRLRGQLASLRAAQALQREVAGRRVGLPLLLRDLAAATPPELELRSLREVPDGLVLAGVSLDEPAVSRFVAALEPRLRLRGLIAAQPSVSPARDEPYYAFTLRFARGGRGGL